MREDWDDFNIQNGALCVDTTFSTLSFETSKKMLFSSACPACFILIFLLHVENSEGIDQEAASHPQNVTSIVLVGATGDLAKRYLWRGFFELFRQETTSDNTFRLYAAARESFETGKKKIDAILEDSLKCPGSDHACIEQKRNFIQLTQYLTLKDEKDYRLLCQEMAKSFKPGERDKGRLFYLSVPPFAYAEIAKRIDSFCRSKDKQSWTRLVLEKPFGSDLSSARQLAEKLANYFGESEIYRIDHYLGKNGVTQILDFRFNNRELLEHLWNRDHIDRVEIVLKERSDCKGRTSFYDHYGVIRDVMQNHMTELLALVAMEMPNNLDDQIAVQQNKLRLLKDTKTLKRWSGVMGQYRQYNAHYNEEKLQDKTTDSETSNTPTFAAASIFIDKARWQGVPFILVSGKQLDERAAYVRIVFKDNIHRVHSTSFEMATCSIKQIIFNIQGERLKNPGILLSGFRSKPKFFQPLHTMMENQTGELFGCSVKAFYALIQNSSIDAYTSLISAIYHEKRNFFVGTEDLLTSWKIWSQILDSFHGVVPRLYDQESLDVLEFVSVGERLEFSQDHEGGSCFANGICLSQENFANKNNNYKQELFRGYHMVTGTNLQVIRSLAAKIVDHALKAVSLKGTFHLALSGGTSPLMLYETLAFEAKVFPWQHTHIWMVDERCLPLTSQESNFNFIYEKLLRHVSIPHFNIHPMHVMLKGGLCDPLDQGSGHYEAELQRLVTDQQLDFVVLGAGSDGHTASLFPHQSAVYNKDNLICLTEGSGSNNVKSRMTMTLNLLIKAKAVAVLVLGERKQDIVRRLSSGEVDVWNFPVTGIQPETGELIWYIDSEALGRL
ncbi:GDH/6PGL endoplasmic bifunctional protein-like [Acropora muricata]|uniref:GDH/6PGL endoplasmic bifunctional protein-like n=1 Tax=Acropora muricata TaxID=159855 RepID=UPI0034E4F081